MDPKPTVAILGDHRDIVNMAQTLLEHEGFNIVLGSTNDFIGDKKDVSEFLRENSPDVVLIDVPLPFPEYVVFVEKMKRLEKTQNTSIVLMSIVEKEIRTRLDPSIEWEILGLPLENIDELAVVIKRSLEKREEPPLTRGERGY